MKSFCIKSNNLENKVELKGHFDNLYEELSEADDEETRADINAEIEEKELEFEAELDEINRKIYLVSVKENAIEMEVKHLDFLKLYKPLR